MNVQVKKASVDQQPVLKRLLQFYQYDFSEFEGWDVGDDGLFEEYRYLDYYWTEPGRFPFLINVDGKVAGFVLVTSHSALQQAGETRWIAEFFVMRKYRRRGVGRAAARHVFDRFPGRWEIGQITKNVAAQAFWRRVIGEYTGGAFTETTLDSDKWHGPVQSFDNSDRGQGSAQS